MRKEKSIILARKILTPPLSWIIPGHMIAHADRLDAKFFAQKKINIVNQMMKKWIVKPLKDLCLPDGIFRGNAPYKPEYVEYGVPVLTTDTLTGHGIDWSSAAFVPYEVFERLRGKKLVVNDIVIATTGLGSIGKADIIGFIPLKLGESILATPKLTIIRADPKKVFPYYLLTFIRSIAGQVQIQSMVRGQTGQLELYPHDIARIIVPIPPSEKQKWIGGPLAEAEKLRKEKLKLKEKLTGWERELVEEVSLPRAFIIPREDLKERLDAKFYYHRKRARVSFKVKTVELGAVVDNIATGSTPGRYDYEESGVPILKVGNLTNEGIDWENISFVDVDFYDSRKKAHVENEDVVIVSAAHSPEGIGKKADVVIIPEEFAGKCMAVAELLIIRPDKRKINPYFLAWALRLEPVRMQMRGMIRGQSAHLYPQDAGELLIPYPPRDIQDEIGDLVKKIMELRIQANVLQKEAEKRLIQLLAGER